MDIGDFGMFSLEKEDGNELFLTHQPRCSGVSDQNVKFGDTEKEESSSSGSLGNQGWLSGGVYSDISEDENDFENPVYGRTKR